MAVRLNEEVKQALAGEETPKFLATLNAEGRPNCVPVISIMPFDDQHLVFGEFLMNKSRKNLLVNDHVGIAVFTDARTAWSLKGTFLGFETSGARVDLINRTPMFRYNAYTSVRAAGLIRVEEVSDKRRLTNARFLRDLVRVQAVTLTLNRRRQSDGRMPRRVEEKYRRVAAVRAVAFRDSDAFPRVFPVLTCLPAGPNRLVFSGSLFSTYTKLMTRGADLAIPVITHEPVAYQVKGRYEGKKVGAHLVRVTECYSASPPLPGDRLDAGQESAADSGVDRNHIQ